MAFLLLLTACGNNEGKKETPQTPSTTTGSAETLTGTWYRQYMGTVAGRPVTVDLEFSNGRLSGTYTYDEHDLLIDLYASDSSTAGKYFMYETNPLLRPEDKGDDHWLLSFTGGTATGQWVSYDGAKKYDIRLQEVDYKNTYKFDLFSQDDSVVVKLKNCSVSAQTTNSWYAPAAMANADKQFFNSIVLRTFGCKEQQPIADCIKKANATYFAEYVSGIDSSISEEESHMYNHEMSRILSIAYNKNGLILLVEGNYQYMGGAHGIHGSSYTCIDMAGKKVWQLGDVITVDTPALIALLEADARDLFHIATNEKLSDRLLVDTINVTDNFHFTSAGITFHYNPYEIASYADGEISLFIPFSRLSAYLTPDFKKRLNLLQ